MSPAGVQIRIKGKVQGVGFRPYIWQLAHELNLKGDVCNDAEGVLVRLVSDEDVKTFISLLYQRCPPLAKIESILSQPCEWHARPDDFTIRSSGEGRMDTQIIPDAATCNACLTELFDPQDRRYHYPFINCTHCGPRFTIMHKMPYDRPNTAMADFPLCPSCLSEYRSPADRRFHAQPNACPDCGPYIWICQADGDNEEVRGGRALDQAVELLLAGGVLAVKGIGGFHLACDATNSAAVELLRRRKLRPSKPLAVMLPSVEWINRCCAQDSPGLRQLMQSSPSPIVLVTKALESPISDGVAPGLNELGVMLPSNPLQHLLMQQVGRPIVMTSGNSSGKPPVLTNRQALVDLKNIADSWLMHNRDIVQRADDSLVRYVDGSAEMMRRARGYVPDAFELPAGFEGIAPVLALGADLKNTFCLLRGNAAVLGPHLGDLDDLDIQQQFERSLALFQDIYGFSPSAIVVDTHPEYVSHRYGQQLAQRLNVPLIGVLHHHAHIASCMAEHCWSVENGPVIGLALDGLGYGECGQLWGGECLLVDYQHCQHLGGLPAVAMPGGDRASSQPWRNLLAQWLHFLPDWQQYPESTVITEQNWKPLAKAIDRGLNSPLASSCGRLFDAVAAALLISPQGISWEGEAACKLEGLARQSLVTHHPVSFGLKDNQLDLAAFWSQWLAYQGSRADRAYAFHAALAQGFAEMAKMFAQRYQVNTVVLSGGVMHNRLLRELLVEALDGIDVLYPQRLSMGDGGLALGQAVIAAAQQ